jgi:hypothetical protein
VIDEDGLTQIVCSYIYIVELHKVTLKIRAGEEGRLDRRMLAALVALV